MPWGRKRDKRGDTVKLPYPHPGQIKVRQNLSRFNWLIAGRRWRKTTLAVALAVESNLQGAELIWGAPTYDQVSVGFEECKKSALGVAIFNESKMSMRFPGAGVTYFRSLDNPDNARGRTADGVIIDEVADVEKEAYTEVLRPMLIDTEGWLLAMGTPKGYNWVYEEFQAAHGRDDSFAIAAPTRGYFINSKGHIFAKPHAYENTSIRWGEIEQIWNKTCPLIHGTDERDLTNAYSFHQEIGASFAAIPGGIIFNTWSDHNVTNEADYVPGAGEVVWGVDDGYVGRLDPTNGHYTPDSHPRTFLLAQLRANGQICIFAEDYGCQLREDEHLKRVLDLPYPEPDYAAVDKSAAALKRWMHDEGIGTINGPGNVEESIKEFRSGIGADDNGFRRVIVHPRCTHLIWEMTHYRRDDRNQKPIKEHDHGVDAGRYLYWTQRIT